MFLKVGLCFLSRELATSLTPDERDKKPRSNLLPPYLEKAPGSRQARYTCHRSAGITPVKHDQNPCLSQPSDFHIFPCSSLSSLLPSFLINEAKALGSVCVVGRGA